MCNNLYVLEHAEVLVFGKQMGCWYLPFVDGHIMFLNLQRKNENRKPRFNKSSIFIK